MRLMVKWAQKWRRRFQTMVRYRLMFLTSAPIFLTLIALIGITIYWSIQYTWQNALHDVSERLEQAKNTLVQEQTMQQQQLDALANSYQFRDKLQSQELDSWLKSEKLSHHWDFISFKDKPRDSGASLEVLLASELSEKLKQKAIVPIKGEDGIESRALSLVSHVRVEDQNGKFLGTLTAGRLINNNDQLVDSIRDRIYPKIKEVPSLKGTVTLFLDDLRVASNVPLNQSRAVGTFVSDKVRKQVLLSGNTWSDLATINDTWYISAYLPLKNGQDETIGMLYTGYRMKPFLATYLTNIVEVAVITVLILALSGIAVYRGSRDLFAPFERIHRVVRLVQIGKPTRIGDLGLNEDHELAQLARQFDNMLDSLEASHQELQQAAHSLEDKVERRTQSLHEKTQQLEHHIKLLNQTRDKLVVSEKLAALGELTAGIAHEINNPVAVILGNIELIKLELSMAGAELEVDEEVATIIAQIDRIRNITHSLLQYSRQGGIQDEVTWQYVNPIIEESVVLVKTGDKKRGIEFITNLKARSSVEINRNQLLQVLVNLQMNAVHAMDSRGKLIIESEDWLEHGETQGALIRVIDEGCGIAPARLARIFDPFYTTKRQGTGLGLSLSQSLLSQVGGELLAESVEGKGSTFTIVLPRVAQPQLQVANL
ncbi:sensor histidine kinase [Vibrio ishigakensis]|uniref:sensor histidine kinase n=1 Tax=Vibrio ishigakensis TaxID=1481914 RepID=UPI0021C3F472|nr:HAMP domain-containing sensor histidine kinase [Vibrio ishigakensis]